jgi:hypothetical protein
LLAHVKRWLAPQPVIMAEPQLASHMRRIWMLACTKLID